MPAIAIREVVEEAYAADPEAKSRRQPAIFRPCALAIRRWMKYSTPLLYLSFHALQAYRIGHWLWRQGRRALAIFCKSGFRSRFQVDIRGGENWPRDYARPCRGIVVRGDGGVRMM